MDRFAAGPWAAFDIEGIAPVAYATFALAVGLFAGLVLRRVVPAMAATLLLFTVTRVFVEAALRPGFQQPLVAPAMSMRQGSWPAGSSNYWADAHGVPISTDQVNSVMSGYSGTTSDGVMAYMHSHGIDLLAAYHPLDRFWTFQFIEAGVFFLLAVLLFGGTLWWLRRRAV